MDVEVVLFSREKFFQKRPNNLIYSYTYSKIVLFKLNKILNEITTYPNLIAALVHAVFMYKFINGREIINLNDMPTYFLKYKYQMYYVGIRFCIGSTGKIFNTKILFIKTFARILFEYLELSFHNLTSAFLWKGHLFLLEPRLGGREDLGSKFTFYDFLYFHSLSYTENHMKLTSENMFFGETYDAYKIKQKCHKHKICICCNVLR